MDLQIFTTGGTIDKVYFDALSDFKVGAPQIVDILRQVNAGLTYEVQTLMQKDSLELTDADREIIAQHVAEAPCQRVLITHGTDTMVDTAQVLAVHDAITDKTVVLVGSLTPARFKHSDVTGFVDQNLITRIAVRPHPHLIGLSARACKNG